MLTVFTATLSPMLVMFLCMLAGFLLKVFRILPDNTATVLSKLESYCLLPALILNTFITYCTVESISSEYVYVLFGTGMLAVSMALAYLLCRFFTKDRYKQCIYIYSLTISNIGFMGTSIVPIILGEAALYQYSLFILPLNVAIYIWGVPLLVPTKGGKFNLFKALLNPCCISIFAGIALGLSGIGQVLPSFIKITLKNLQSCMGPVAMILTGFVIAGYSAKELLCTKSVYVATLLRLIVLPAVFVGILYLFHVDRFIMTIMLFGSAMPLGLNTVVFPAAYGGDTSTGASMAAISHVLCVLTIPVMYALLQLLP